MAIIDVEDCPIRKTFAVIGSKWAMLILWELRGGPRRYSEIKKNIPDASEKMITEKLKLLEENKFITRKDYGEVPPRVDYTLSPNGEKALKLIPTLVELGIALK